MNNIRNCIIILIDGARSYPTNVDDRGLPEVFQQFKKSAYNFENAFTSAPSTVMSLSGMFTGVPAYLHSLHYNAVDLDDLQTEFLTNILVRHGVKIFGALYYPLGRYYYRNLWPPIPPSFLEKSKKRKVWGNEYTARIFERALDSGMFREGRNFVYLHFNVRAGEERYDNKIEVSIPLQRVLEGIKSSRMDEESLIIMCSDHGYPSPMSDHKLGMAHDLILDEDNIRIPLSTRFPDQLKRVDITHNVQNIDLFPTVLDVFDIKKPNHYFHGIEALYPVSLIEAISDEKNMNDRVLRIDNRYWGQEQKAKLYVNNDLFFMSSIVNGQYKWTSYESNESNGKTQFPNKLNSEIKSIDSRLEQFMTKRALQNVVLFFSKSEKRTKYIIDITKNSSSTFFVKSVLWEYPDCVSIDKFLPLQLFLRSQIVIVSDFQKTTLIEESQNPTAHEIVMALPLRSVGINIIFRIIQVAIHLPLILMPNILVIDNIGRSLPQLISFFIRRFFSKVFYQLFSSRA